MPIPFAAMADTYTACAGPLVAPEAKERSVYNLTFRRSPRVAWPELARDHRLVFWGLGHYLREVLGGPLDFGAERAAAFFESHGPLRFDRELWRGVERLGFLPIRITATPDGAAFWPGEPVVQVESTRPGFGEVAAHVEATLVGMVACATARATVSRHLRMLLAREVQLDETDLAWEDAWDRAAGMVHDFGMRASSTPLEAVIFGQAHLLSFTGTDTAPAAFAAWDDSGDECAVGTSIMAQAHRIILGHATEAAAVAALADAIAEFGFPIGSFLADTFDTRAFVANLAIPLAWEYCRRGAGRVIVRPDSGDALANLGMIFDLAAAAGLVVADNQGRAVSPHLGVLLGDSVTPYTIAESLGYLRTRGAHATSWVSFGIGGWLRMQGNRDVLSAAYKLAAVGPDDRPVVKFSEVRAKCSVPGPTVVLRPRDVEHWEPHDPDQPTVFLRSESRPAGQVIIDRTAYLDGKARLNLRFSTTRNLSLESWDDLPDQPPATVYSPAIERLRDPSRNPSRGKGVALG